MENTTNTETIARQHNAQVIREVLAANPSLEWKVRARILHHFEHGEGNALERITAAAWEAHQECKALGWTDEQLGALAESFAVAGADMVASVIKATQPQ